MIDLGRLVLGGKVTAEPVTQDEVAQVLAIPSVLSKVKRVETSIGARTAPYVRRAFRFCYNASFSHKEIAEGLGITDVATISRFGSACKALLAAGLFRDAGDGRYTVNRDEIGRLRVLAEMVR